MDANKELQLQSALTDAKNPNLRFETCKLLLDGSNNINDHNDETHPLHLFLNSECNCEIDSNRKLLQLLIDKSLRIDDESRKIHLKDMALSKAVESGDLIAMKILLEAKAYLNQNVMGIILRGQDTIKNTAILKLLHRYHTNLNDWRVFYYAVTNELWDILKLFLEYGDGLSKVCATHHDSRWLLDMLLYRIHCERADILEYLLDNALDINIFATDSYFCILRKVYPAFSKAPGGKLKIKCSPKKRKMLNIVMKHIAIVMEIGKFPVRESTMCLIKDKEPLEIVFHKYSEQIRLMRNSYVQENSKITYFDLLTKRGKQLTRCCDENILTLLSGKEVRTMFPDFVAKLTNNVQIGVEQRNLIEEFKQMLYGIFQTRFSFDLICYICDFLEMKDFKVYLLRDVGL